LNKIKVLRDNPVDYSMDEEREILDAMKAATTKGDDVKFKDPLIYPYQRKMDLLKKYEENFI